MREIAVYGAGGFGLEVGQLIEQINEVKRQWKFIGYFDDWVKKGEEVNGYPILGGMKDLNAWANKLDVALAIGNPERRSEARNSITNPAIGFPELIHPSAIVERGRHVTVGEGCIICAGCIVTTQVTIGRHVILNLACTVGHESKIGDFCSFMPTCNISGEVKIGEGVFFGTGAKIINEKKVGAHSVVGAGAVVIADLPEGCTAVGVPARIVKRHEEEQR